MKAQHDPAQSYDEFIDGLVRDFDIPDRDELTEIISVAELEYQMARDTGHGGSWSDGEAEALDKLDAPLWKTVELIRHLQYPLAKAIIAGGGDEGEVARAEDDLYQLVERLAEVGRVAAKIERRRRRRGQRLVRHGRDKDEQGKNVPAAVFEYEPLRRLMGILVGYWTETIGPFTQNQTAWIHDGPHNLEIPAANASKGVRFAFRVIEHIAPGKGGALKTLARAYTK